VSGSAGRYKRADHSSTHAYPVSSVQDPRS
jgi:hypothetical protein